MLNLAASSSRKMQKYLKFLNFRLDVVVKDVCGLTGLKIIEDICKGNLDPHSLAEHRHYNCKKPKQEIAKALHGNNREDFLFGLKQEFESYQFYQKKIKACDKIIERFISFESPRHRAKAERFYLKFLELRKNPINDLKFMIFSPLRILRIHMNAITFRKLTKRKMTCFVKGLCL